MEKELFEHRLKKHGDDFWEYGRIYHHTNENLKEYIPDLTGKKILTVSASGDHILNCLGMGALHIDTFDINKFSPLYQDLKLQSIKELPEDFILEFLSTLRYDLYLKFNDCLSCDVKEFFDFLYHNYSIKQIKDHLFYECDINPSSVNNYYDIEVLRKIKNQLNDLNHIHYSTNFFNLTNTLDTCYDTMFFSNISHYANPIFFISYLKTLYEFFLNEGGEIYFAYIYNTHGITSPIDGLLHISDKYKECKGLKDFSKNVEFINFDSAEYDGYKDAVLVLKK